jgi:hypothetical protein
MTEPHPALDVVVDDLGDEDEGALVIIEERSGPVTCRWVRFVMPVMVEVDRDDDTVTRVVTLPEEIREDRDDRGHFSWVRELADDCLLAPIGPGRGLVRLARCVEIRVSLTVPMSAGEPVG